MNVMHMQCNSPFRLHFHSLHSHSFIHAHERRKREGEGKEEKNEDRVKMGMTGGEIGNSRWGRTHPYIERERHTHTLTAYSQARDT